MNYLPRLIGTFQTLFRIGARELRDNGNDLELRNTVDGSLAGLKASQLILPTGAVDGYILSTNAAGYATWIPAPSSGGSVTVTDGTVTTVATTINFPADSLTDNGSGNVTVTFGSGSSKPTMQAMITFLGDLTTGTHPLSFYNTTGVAHTITKLFASVGTASGGADIIVSLLVNGTPSASLTIPAGATTATATISQAWNDNIPIRAEITQVGLTTAGANLALHIVHQEN